MIITCLPETHRVKGNYENQSQPEQNKIPIWVTVTVDGDGMFTPEKHRVQGNSGTQSQPEQ